MKLLNIFALIFLLSILLLSCQNEENQFIRQDNQINALVKKAELETNTLSACFNANEKLLIIDKNGLSANYQIGTQNHYFQNGNFNLSNEKLLENSILSALKWENYSSDQFEKIKKSVENFELKQENTIQIAKASIVALNDSLKHFIDDQNEKLKNKEISKIQYDEIMTDVQDTFLSYLRSIYEEQKIYIGSSTNYRCLLQEIQGILTEKQWEEFFSCVYKK